RRASATFGPNRKLSNVWPLPSRDGDTVDHRGRGVLRRRRPGRGGVDHGQRGHLTARRCNPYRGGVAPGAAGPPGSASRAWAGRTELLSARRGGRGGAGCGGGAEAGGVRFGG